MPKRVSQKGVETLLPGEAEVRALADPKVFERGREVARSGAVSDLVRRGNVLTAAVAGSEDEPYRVTIHLEDGQMIDPRCTCPYEWGDVCKHIVATLIAAGKPGAVAERPPLRQLLDGLSREALTDLLLRRAGSDPDLPGWIEVELATTPGPGAVDPAPLAAQARTVLARRARTYWDDYDSAGPADELQSLVEKAVPFLEAGDGRNALRVLVAVAEPFVEQWLGEMAETDEEMYLLFEDLGRMMAEAVLMGDLSEDERDALFETVEGWQADLDDYAPDGFSLVTAALAAGWDGPALQAVLAGKARAALPESEKELVAVRLRVLAATGRTEEYLNLARAAGDGKAYAGMLVRLGRADEAVAYATRHVTRPDQTLSVARRLREAGHPDQALDLARSGLRRAGEESGSAGALARWLRDEAVSLKRRDLALDGARAAFAAGHALDDYVAARTIAGKGWEPVRDDLLAILAKTDFAHDRIAILLEERLIGDAMQAAELSRESDVDEDVLHRLAEAALQRDPAWVARFAEERARPFLNGGSSRHYEKAATWLAHARTAYLAQGRQAEWAARIEALIAEHKRRHSLKPRLVALR